MTMVYENIRLALSSLKANKMRALLTMLGIIIGIASVIAIMTVGNTITTSVTDSMSSMGASNITVGLQQKSEEEDTKSNGMSFGPGMGRSAQPTSDDYMTKDMIEAYVEKYGDDISAISATESIGSGQITSGSQYANVTLSGVSLGYFVANSLTFKQGEIFSDQEFEDGTKVCLISDYAVNNIFDGDIDEAIGNSVQVTVGNDFYTFTVVGVYEYEESASSFSSSSTYETTTDMLVPLKTAQAITHNTAYSQFTVVTKSGADVDSFISSTESFFNSYYRNNRKFEVSAFSMASMLETFTDMLSTITLAISFIAGIALLVGGIGVMNIMLVSITERTREIGTRKALGAPNSSIRLQFIVESIVICIIGGIIGVILGITLGFILAKAVGYSASVSAVSIIVSLLFSMAIGVFFGYYPANKAAQMDPIEALRYE